MRLNEFRQQYPQYNEIPDDELAKALHQRYYSQIPFEDFSQRIGLAAPAVEAPEDVGTFRRLGDIGVGLTQGIYTGAKALTDLLGANNPISQAIGGSQELLSELLSAQAQGNLQRMQEISDEAKDKGTFDQLVAGLKAFGAAPVETMSQAFGTAIPIIAGGALANLTKMGLTGAGLTTGQAIGTQAALGAGMGAGMVKGQIYETVKEELVKAGVDERVAEERAMEAQSYGGQNLDQIFLAAGLGAGAALGPLESVLTKLAIGQPVKQASQNIVRNMVQAGLVEAVPEAVQAAQEQVAQNLALQREGMDVPTFRGVVTQATVEGLAGAALGAPTGLIGQRQFPEAQPPQPPTAPATEPPPAAPPPELGPEAPPAAPPEEPEAVTPILEGEIEGEDEVVPPAAPTAAPPREPIEEPPPMFGKPAPVDPDELARRKEVKALEAQQRTLGRPQKEENLFTVLNKKLNRQGLLKHKADIPKDRMDKISAPRGGGKLLEAMIGDGELDEFLPFDMRTAGLAGQLSPEELLDREQRGFEYMLNKLARNDPLTYENELELQQIGYTLDQLTQEGELNEVNRRLQEIASEELLERAETIAPPVTEERPIGPEGAPPTEAARQAAQQAAVGPSLFGEEEAKEPAAKIKSGLTRYASGMSGLSDLQTGAYTRAGYGRNGVGVDVSLLSKSATDALANAIINYKTPTFIDSGAFSAFRKQIKGQPVDPIDFDKVLAKYDEILEKVEELNPVEDRDYPRPKFVMPDVVGDQDASVDLINRYKNWIGAEVRGNLSDPIVPIQKGRRSLSEVYDEIANILGTRDFIVGVPSQEEAISKADLTEFLKTSQPPKIHFLGAASDKKLNPLLALVAQHSPNTEVSADASKVRSSILSGVAKGKTREQAIQDALRAEDDPYEVFNRYMEQASAPAAPKESVPAEPAPKAAPAAESDVDKLAEAFPNVPREQFEGVGTFAKVKPYIQAAYNKGNLKQVETILNSLRKAAPPIGQVREPTPEEKRLADLERDLFRLTPPATPERKAAPSAQADLFGAVGLESLPDRPQLQKQKQKNNQQLSLFGSEVIDKSENNAAGRKARKAAIDEVKALQDTDTPMGLSFANEFAQKQRANLVGQKINGADDLAVLSQVYRDPQFETFRLFFTDAEGNVISQLGVTSRLPGSSQAIIGDDTVKYLTEVQKVAKDVGATGFWMLHNHPSGNVQSSNADMLLTRTFNKYMPGLDLLGHVIIDTNKYGLIRPDGTYTEISKDMDQKDLTEIQFSSYDDVFNPIEMAKRVDEDQDAMVLVTTNNQLQVTGITTMPNSTFLGQSTEKIQRILMKTALRNMGSRLFVASRNRDALKAVGSSVDDGIYIKDNGQYEVFRQMFSYRTKVTFPVSRPGVVTADSSKLFDFLRKPKVADPGRSKYLNWKDLRVLEPQKEMFGDDVLSKLDNLPKDKSKLPPGRSPELAELTERFARGEITRAERDEAVEKYKKVRIWEETLEPASEEAMRNALNVVQRQKVNAPIPDGTRVGTRIDIEAARKGVSVVTIHEAKPKVTSPAPGSPISYRSVAKLKNVQFAIGSEKKALEIAKGRKKDALQTMEGNFVNITPAEAKREMDNALSDPEYIQVGVDPTAHSYFYDRVTKLPIISADEIIQIGSQVLAKGVEFQEAETFLFNITEDQGHLFEGEGVEKVDSVPAGVKKKVKKGRSPELAEMAEKLKRGEITKEDYDEAVNKFSRPALYAEVPKPATDKAVVDALSSDKRPYANVSVPNGTKVGLRLDIPALERGVGVVSIHQAKPSLTSPKAAAILSYRSVGALKNVKFALGDQTKALDTAAGAFKDKLQTMEGEYVNLTPEEAFAKAKEALNDPEYIQVGFNPIRHAYFYDRLTMLPVVSADEVIQIGQLVFAKNVEFGDKEDFLYSIGDPITRFEKEIDQSVGMTRQEIINFYQGIRQRRAALVKKVEKGEVSIDVQRRLQELNELGKEMQLDARIMYEPNLSARAFRNRAEKAYLNDEIGADVLGVIETMLAKYPKLLEGLQLSVRTDKTLGDAAGQFNPIKRLITLYKDTSGAERPVTIRHELAHAMEQMMPIGAREAMIREWSKAFQAAIKKHKDAKSQEYFQKVLEFLDRPSKARMEAATRVMPSYDFYQYLNPSEYWAINAEKLMAAQLGTPWNRFVKAMKKLLEGMKKILGFNNKYTTHKTFDQIINGSMKRLDRGSLLDYMIEGDTDIDFLMNMKDVDDLMEKYKRPDTPIETSESVKDAFLGSGKKIKEIAEDIRENPLAPVSKMASNLDRAITFARNKNVWFGTGLNQADFKKYNGQLRNGHNQVVASIAVDNALHAGHVGVQVAMLGKLKYDTNIGMFTAVQDKMSMQNVIKLKAKLVEKLGAQRAANVINGFFEAKRSRSIINEYLEREANFEMAQLAAEGDSKALEEAKKDLAAIEKAIDKVLMSDEEIDDFIALGEQYPELQEMMDNWTAVNHNLLDNMLFSRLISKKRHAKLKAIKDYVPWYRITDDMEDIHSPTAGAIRGLTNVAKEKLFRKGVPKITRDVLSTEGQQDFDIRMNPDAEVFINNKKVDPDRYHLRPDRTLRFNEPLPANVSVKVIQDRPIDDVVDNMLHNVMMITKNVMRNYANWRVVESYGTRNEKGKIRVFATEGTDEDGVRFNIMSNGRRIIVQVKDPLIAEAALGLENLELPVNGILSYFANGFRRSITAFPAFQLKQLFMDAPGAAWVSGVKNPFAVWGKTFSSFIAALNPDDPITQILRSKGIGGFQSAFRSPQKELELEIGLIKGNMFAQAIKVLDRIGDASDIAQRRAIYMQVLKESGDETLALSMAQNVIDFLRRGSGRPAQFVTRTVAFANAYAQSIDVLARTLAGGGLKGKERKAAIAQMVKTGMMLSAVTILYSMAVGDDEEYNKLDDQTKFRGFFIPGSKEVFGEPLVLPMSTGASFFFKTIPEIIYNQVMREGTESEMDETRLRKALSTAATDSLLGPNMTPTAVKPFIEIALNRNFFTGSNIIPRSMEDVEAAQQYNATTSELGKVISGLTSVPGTEKRLLAPLEADHLMRSLFGTVAASAMWGTNLLTEERIDTRMKDNPLYGPFFLPPVSRGREDMFYDLKDRVDKKYETYQIMVERGQDEAADAYYDKHEDLIDQRGITEEIAQAIQEINAEIRLIGTTADPDYKKAERTKDIRELQEAKNELLEDIAEIRKEAGL